MAIRFLHAADLHLDTPFTARGRYPEHVAAVLRDASLIAFERLIDAALAHQVAFVVFAGDVYDGPERGVRAQLRFREGLERLSDAGIRSFVAHGNHDPVDEGWSAIDSFPDLATVFPSGEVACVPFEVDGQPVTVHGISYAVAHVTENLVHRFAPPTGAGLHVGVLHANVGQDPGHGAYSPCTVADLCAVGFDYWAMGHVHTRRVLHRDPWVVYPGNLQGRTIKATEGGPKGALLVDVLNGRVSEPRHLPFDVVRFATAQVDITGLDFDGVLSALWQSGESARVGADGRSVLLGATLTGTGDLHDRLADAVVVAELLAELRSQAGTTTPFLWWDSLAVDTRPAHETDGFASDGFGADLLAVAAQLGASSGSPEGGDLRRQWASGLAADLARSATAEEPLPSIDLLWAEATALAVDLLSREER